MQLAEALAALKEIGECAQAEGMDTGLRMAWIAHRTAEAEAVATENYGTAEYHKTQCNALVALMRMTARAVTVEPIVIGGELEDYENAIGRAVWHRSAPGDASHGR